MDPFARLEAIAAPLRRNDVDTDTIIPIARLTTVGRNELGPFAFEPLRVYADGNQDSEFVLNRAPWNRAAILISGRNFGCGSSREAAVWALIAAGIRCVIAPSFGDIFYDNCFQNGLLPVRLEAGVVERLFQRAERGQPLVVDLVRCEIEAGGDSLRFEIDAWRRDSLLQGLDPIEYTLRLQGDILNWQQEDRVQRPWIWNSTPH